MTIHFPNPVEPDSSFQETLKTLDRADHDTVVDLLEEFTDFEKSLQTLKLILVEANGKLERLGRSTAEFRQEVSLIQAIETVFENNKIGVNLNQWAGRG